MKPDFVNRYRIKLGLSVAFIITLMTFAVLFQDAPFQVLFMMAAARFVYLLAIWMLYFPVAKRFRHKLLAFFIYLLVCMVAVLPLVYYNLWVNEAANILYPPFEDFAHIKKPAEFLTFYYFSRAVGMGMLIFPIQYREDLVRDKQFYLLANEKLKNQNLLHQIESLKQELDPHFLFNTLNALKTLISVDPVRAEKYAVEISDVYRYLLQHNRNKSVLLQEEFNFLRAYLSLLQLRFEDNLQVNINIDEALYNKMIFPLSLQLLVENAVKHNVVTRESPLQVQIYSKGESIVVENRINLRSTTDGVSQYGLAHLSKLYQLHYNQDIDITNTTTIFSVSLPLING
jgi:sensor histidine kinase YesM